MTDMAVGRQIIHDKSVTRSNVIRFSPYFEGVLTYQAHIKAIGCAPARSLYRGTKTADNMRQHRTLPDCPRIFVSLHLVVLLVLI